MQIVQICLRAVQFIFTLIITALIGNVIHGAFAGNPSSVNFAMFVAAWSWIALIIGGAAAFVEAVPGIIVLITDALAVL